MGARGPGRLDEYFEPIPVRVHIPLRIELRRHFVFRASSWFATLALCAPLAFALDRGHGVGLAFGVAVGVAFGLIPARRRSRRLLATAAAAPVTPIVPARRLVGYPLLVVFGVMLAVVPGILVGTFAAVFPTAAAAALGWTLGCGLGADLFRLIAIVRWEHAELRRVTAARRSSVVRLNELNTHRPPTQLRSLAKGTTPIRDGDIPELVAVAAAAHFRRHYGLAAELSARLFEHTGAPAFAYNRACSLARRGLAQSAIAALDDAATAGWSDIAHLDRDHDLDRVRQLQDFARIRDRVLANRDLALA